MKKKLIPIILVSLSCILFIVAIVVNLNTNYFSLSNKTEINENETKEEQSQSTIKEENNKVEETNKEQIKPNNQTTNKETNNKNETQDTTKNEESKKEENTTITEPETIKNEDDVINYFSLKDSDITENIDQDDRTLREKAKDAFVTVVDFIFYDKEIKGYTFKELTTSAKIKIVKIALTIDNKIDEYFPDYKDVIKDKYENITGKLAVKYLEFTSNLCEKVGKDTCNQAKEDFNNMKESFGITWELIKELAKSGSSKVKEFYENWRDS